ncbi:MAG: hypothetical protein WDW38_009543 [Sanguina aurantia]
MAKDSSDDDLGVEDTDSSDAGEDETDGEEDQDDGPLTLSNAVDDTIMPGASSDSPLLLFQVQALLGELRHDPDEMKVIERCVAQLRQALSTMQQRQVTGASIPGFMAAVGVPCEESMPVGPPTRVSIVGSFSTGTSAPSHKVVDVAIEMPDDCLFQKAHLNHRYHARRAMYLAAVSDHLTSTSLPSHTPAPVQSKPSSKRSSSKAAAETPTPAAAAGMFSDQALTNIGDDPRRPALLLHPCLPSAQRSSKTSTPTSPPTTPSLSPATFSLRLLPTASPSAIATAKLGPERNSIRSVSRPIPPTAAAPLSASGTQPPAPAETEKLLPTPHYNASILQDLLMVSHAQALRSAFAKFPRLQDTVLLLKVWAHQHHLSQPCDGLSGPLLSWLAVYLAQCGRLAPAMSSLQMLRLALESLTQPWGLSKGLALAHASPPILGMPPNSPPLKTFKRHCAVVLIGPSGWLNIASSVSAASMRQIQAVARSTITLLSSKTDPVAAFRAALLTPPSPAAAFDYHWRVRVPELDTTTAVDASQPLHQQKPGDVVRRRDLEAKVEALVAAALTDRATLVRVCRQPLAAPAPSPTTHSSPHPESASYSHGVPGLLAQGLAPFQDPGEIWVGAQLDPTSALRPVDIGPAADDLAAAARFRAFWGSVSELRQFQDGKISEAVVWASSPAERHTIPDKIVQYTLGRHLPKGCTVTSSSNALDWSLVADGVHPTEEVAASRALDAALDKLGKQLRGLSGVALKVMSVQPLSGSCRHTSPFSPQPHPLAGGGNASASSASQLLRCMDPVEVLVQLEGSGVWSRLRL